MCASVAKDAFGIFDENGVISTLFVSQKVRPFSYNVWTSGGRSTLSRSGRYKSNSGFVTPARTLKVNVLACCVPERGVGDTRHGIKRADGGFLYPLGNTSQVRLWAIASTFMHQS